MYRRSAIPYIAHSQRFIQSINQSIPDRCIRGRPARSFIHSEDTVLHVVRQCIRSTCSSFFGAIHPSINPSINPMTDFQFFTVYLSLSFIRRKSFDFNTIVSIEIDSQGFCGTDGICLVTFVRDAFLQTGFQFLLDNSVFVQLA